MMSSPNCLEDLHVSDFPSNMVFIINLIIINQAIFFNASIYFFPNIFLLMIIVSMASLQHSGVEYEQHKAKL